MVLEEECGGVCEPSQGEAPCRQEERKRPSPQGVLLSLGPVMMVGGGRTLDVCVCVYYQNNMLTKL